MLKQTQYLQRVRGSSQDEGRDFKVRSPGCAGGFPDMAAAPLSWVGSAWARPYVTEYRPWRYCSGWAAGWTAQSAAAG